MDELQPQKVSFPTATLEQMLKNPTIGRVYANGFLGGRSQTDIFIVPVSNGIPQLIMNLSFSTAKNLRDLLDKSIKDVEEKLGHEIKSIEPYKKSE